jgi:hypothetical protein
LRLYPSYCTVSNMRHLLRNFIKIARAWKRENIHIYIQDNTYLHTDTPTHNLVYIVASRPGARQRPRSNYTAAVARQRPANRWKEFSAQSARQQLNDNNEDRCFLRGPCRDVINGTSWELQGSQSEE